MEKDKFGCVIYTEAKTGGGQMLEIRCRPEDEGKVKKALGDIESIDIPFTKQVKSIGHGCYGKYTRYDIIQHEYAGGHGGYMEVLEIKNPPDGKCEFVIHEYFGGCGSRFWEFTELEYAIAAWKKDWTDLSRARDLSKIKGLIRAVKCGCLSPWFYAVADQFLMGDFVFPDVVAEDPIFRFGRKFVINDDGIFTIKTCMGVYNRIYESDYDRKKKEYKRVYWDDGTFNDYWNNDDCRRNLKPLDDNQLWVVEAMDRFRELLNGDRKGFTIEFQDGGKFIGQWKAANPKDKTVAGRYKVSLTLESGKKMEGEFDFEPTKDVPTVMDCLKKQAEKKGVKIEKIHSLARNRSGFAGKKWAGVF